jgi:Ca2+-binding EF-hand superfamily protein
LSDHKQFDGYSLFKCIDKKGNGFVKIQDLVDFMNLVELYLNRKQAAALFCCLDFCNDGVLNYLEFLNAILPKKLIKSTKPFCYEYSKNPSRDKEADLDHILKDFSTLLLQYINTYFTLQSLRNQFDPETGLNLKYYFGLVDQDQKGVWIDDDIYTFLRVGNDGIGFDDVKVIIDVFSKWSNQVTMSQFVGYFRESENRARGIEESGEYKGLRLMRASERGMEMGRGGSIGEGGEMRICERSQVSPARSDRACQEFEVLNNRSSQKGFRDVKDRNSGREVGSHRGMKQYLVERGIGENFEMSKSVPLDGETVPREDEGLREPSLLFSPQGKDESYVELKVRFLVVKYFRMAPAKAHLPLIETNLLTSPSPSGLLR